MYTYLNQRYGLKNLIIEWAAAIINAIKTYQREDHDIALFGKILRNECDEEFRFIQQTVKETVIALLRSLIKEKYSTKPESVHSQMLESVLSGQVNMEVWQWKKIIEKMYDEDDYRLIEQQLQAKLQQKVIQANKQRPQTSMPTSVKNRPSSSTIMRRQTPRAQNQQMPGAAPEKLKFVTFLKTVLDFQLTEHEKFLSFFVSQFTSVDSDRDGVLTETQFIQLMHQISRLSDDDVVLLPPERIEHFLRVIDPHSNLKVTFSECVHLLSSESMSENAHGNEMTLLEFLSTCQR